jgi:hypothetical protein
VCAYFQYERDTVRFCPLRGEQVIDMPYVLVHINIHNVIYRQIGLHPFLLLPWLVLLFSKVSGRALWYQTKTRRTLRQ